MTTTITLTAKEVEELIKAQLRANGFEVTGGITFNVTAGYSDPREYQAPGLTNVTAVVSTIQPRRSFVPSAEQIDGPVYPR